MAPAGDANALANGAGRRAALQPRERWRFGHTECDVGARQSASPTMFSLSNNPRGDRVAVVTFSRRRGRAGIYTFTAGPADLDRARAPSRSLEPKYRQAQGEEEAGRDIAATFRSALTFPAWSMIRKVGYRFFRKDHAQYTKYRRDMRLGGAVTDGPFSPRARGRNAAQTAASQGLSYFAWGCFLRFCVQALLFTCP